MRAFGPKPQRTIRSIILSNPQPPHTKHQSLLIHDELEKASYVPKLRGAPQLSRLSTPHRLCLSTCPEATFSKATSAPRVPQIWRSPAIRPLTTWLTRQM